MQCKVFVICNNVSCNSTFTFQERELNREFF